MVFSAEETKSMHDMLRPPKRCPQRPPPTSGRMDEGSRIKDFPFSSVQRFFKAKKGVMQKTLSQRLKRATKTCELLGNIMLQNELESEFVRFITHVQTCLATRQLRE